MSAANLQRPVSRTAGIKAAAELMNVSERSVWNASKLIASGREDLCQQVLNGTLRLNAALGLAYGTAKPKADRSRFAALCRAWNAASEDDQGRFLVCLGHAPPPAPPPDLAARLRALGMQNDPDIVRSGLAEIAAELDALHAKPAVAP
jgi:hypothetical protein